MHYQASGLSPMTLHGYVTPPREDKDETEGHVVVYPYGINPERPFLTLNMSIDEAEALAAKLTELADAARRGDYSSYDDRGRSDS